MDRQPTLRASLRSLPAVGKLLLLPAIRTAAHKTSEAVVRWALRETVEEERARRLRGAPSRDEAELVASALHLIDSLASWQLRSVVNATGVVINTNLGRSPLPEEALKQLNATASGYCNLEMDLESGQRGSRHSHIAKLLSRLTGAEAALVVNNCAAAVLLLTDTFARGREVIVSRGQLIEIGGSFRLPEVLEASGARLREVGTTNKTYLEDYRRALTSETGLLLISHTSNYRILGFTAEVARADLAELGRAENVVTAEDLGSGLLVDLKRYGLPEEPTVQQSLAAGIDVVMVSGDKLLGGPQAGLILGRARCIEKMRKNPLMRALRPDKLALAALEGTLRCYLGSAHPHERIPVFHMLNRGVAELKMAAQDLADRLAPRDDLSVRLVSGVSTVGGGTLPGVEMLTWLVAVRPKTCSVEHLAGALRRGSPAVVARIGDGQLLLDPRTLMEGDVGRIQGAIAQALAEVL
ncbi:MAG: L-seryl-tRNA(Sec) selenium transferase [Candidatus Sericytochromatia bacterium]|nr:L-seryl-tRNA(Sec) selenium transferase [Candidatus Sericytochromatia bacterium]